MRLIKEKLPHLVLLSLILIFFGEKIIPSNDLFIGGLDVHGAYYWWYLYAKDQIFTGNMPLWNPYIAGGIPFVPNYLYYPSFFLFLTLPMPWAFNLDVLLHFFLAGLGMYYFVTLTSGSKHAGLISAVTYCFSGYMMDRLFAGHQMVIYSASAFPWIFYCTEKAIKHKNISFYILTGLLLGIPVLGGDPQNAFYIASSVAIYYFLRIISKKSFNHKIFLYNSLKYLLIPLCSFCIAAVQLLPLWQFKNFTPRINHSFEAVTLSSFPIQNFFTFLVPKPNTSELFINWELSGYIGVLSLLLSFIGLLFSVHKKYKWPIGVIAIFSITLMLGKYTPIYQYYYKILPFIGDFRAPCRGLIILVLALSVFSGFGAQYLFEHKGTKIKNIIIIFSVLFALTFLLIGSYLFKIQLNSTEMIIAFSFIFISFLLFMGIKFIKNKYIITGIFLSVIFIDFLVIYKPQIPQLDENVLLEKREYELFFEKQSKLFRVLLPESIAKYRAPKFNYFNVSGYAPGYINDYFNFLHIMADAKSPKFDRHYLNPKLYTKEKAFSSKILNLKYALVKTSDGYEMIQAKKVMPRAVLVRNVVALPKEQHIDYIKQPGFDPQSEVLLESIPDGYKPSTSEKSDNHSNDAVSITKYEPNRIELSSSSDSNTFLVLSEIFYPGWHAYVDGNKVQIQRTDYLLRAIPLYSGCHDIVFVYRPLSFIIGVVISFSTVLLLVAILIYSFKKFRLKTPSDL